MKTLAISLGLLLNTTVLMAQKEQPKDTIQEPITLDEVLVSAVRVTAQSPVTFSNISKREIRKRNLGQDIPILMNFLPGVVTTTDAGAGVGYTGIRVRGVMQLVLMLLLMVSHTMMLNLKGLFG